MDRLGRLDCIEPSCAIAFVEIPSEVAGTNDNKATAKWPLNTNDSIHASIMNRHFSTVGPLLNQKAHEIDAYYKVPMLGRAIACGAMCPHLLRARSLSLFDTETSRSAKPQGGARLYEGARVLPTRASGVACSYVLQ